MMSISSLQSDANMWAQAWGVPSNLFSAVIGAESSWNPNAYNPTAAANGEHAVGIAQFLPSTAAQYGVDPTNADESLQGAAQYLHDLYGQYGSWGAAVKAYGTTSGNASNPSIDKINAITSALDSGQQTGDTSSSSQSSTTNNPIGSAASGWLSKIGTGFTNIVVVVIGIVVVGVALFGLIKKE